MEDQGPQTMTKSLFPSPFTSSHQQASFKNIQNIHFLLHPQGSLSGLSHLDPVPASFLTTPPLAPDSPFSSWQPQGTFTTTDPILLKLSHGSSTNLEQNPHSGPNALHDRLLLTLLLYSLTLSLSLAPLHPQTDFCCASIFQTH